MKITLNNSATFPAGTTVKAYAQTNWPESAVPPSGAPRGISAAEGVAGSDGAVVLDGLTEKTEYCAAAEVGGVWRYLRFFTAPRAADSFVVGSAGEAGKVLAADDPDLLNATESFDEGNILKGSALPVSVVTDSRNTPVALESLMYDGSTFLPVSTPFRTELYSIYDAVADGAVPPDADSGQAWTIYGGTQNVPLEIKDGKLTTPFKTAIEAAAYFGVALDNAVQRMGAEWTFEQEEANQDGALNLTAWTTALDSLPVGARSAPVHLTLTPISWSVLIYVEGTPTTVISEFFATPLAVDGTTVHRVEWFLLGKKLLVILPNGEIREFEDSRFESIQATHATPELYYKDASEGPRIGVKRVWADSRAELPMTLTPTLRRVASLVQAKTGGKTASATYLPATDKSIVVPKAVMTAADATNLSVKVQVPSSGKILVRFSGYVTVTKAVVLYWQLKHGEASYGPSMRVLDSASFKGNISKEVLIEGLTPGSLTLDWAHMVTGEEGGATLNLYKTNGQLATLTATPLP